MGACVTDHPELQVGVWRGQILPVFSCLALLAVPVLAVVHFDVLTGASQLARLRKASPQQFAALGSHKL